MLFELINPSDPYFFKAKNQEVAALAIFLLGTQYGAKSENGNADVPVFLLGGSKEWYKENFKRTPDEGLKDYRAEVKAALASFTYGHISDYELYETAIHLMAEENKQIYVDKWNDQRSSLNDIRKTAMEIAEKL